jgi:hypothetical protein
MKTIKLIFSIALLALATSSFSQRAFSSKEIKGEFVQVSYSSENSGFSYKLSDYLGKFKRSETLAYHEPMVYMSYSSGMADIVYEEPYSIESWMASPFESSLYEAELSLESWMTSPFDYYVAEAKLKVEQWMTIPFEVADLTEMESWMTAAWN